jgi:hypothetical protein
MATLTRPVGAMDGSIPGQKSSTGSLLNLSGSAQVFVAAVAEDLVPIDSPAFTGAPTVPTAAPGNSSQVVANTAFVGSAISAAIGTSVPEAPNDGKVYARKSLAWTDILGTASGAMDTFGEVETALAAKANLAGPTFTGNPQAPTPAPGDNDTSIATTAFVTAAIAGGMAPPQGRLGLNNAPVLIVSVTNASTVQYLPYQGDKVPIYNGTIWSMTSIGAGLSCATTDTTKNPTAIGASKVNDWFVWNDAGTMRLGHGPDWTSDILRSAGTALTLVNGIYLNSVAITNGPGASRGTYVGTSRSNASSLVDWQFGGLGVGGVPGFFGLWNCYNRVQFVSLTRDSTDSWTLSIAAAWRETLGSSGTNRCTLVRGLDEDGVQASFIQTFTPAGAISGAIGIGLDATTTVSGTPGVGNGAWYQGSTAMYSGHVGIGVHFLQAMNYSNTSAGVTFYGDAGGPSYIQCGLYTLFVA